MAAFAEYCTSFCERRFLFIGGEGFCNITELCEECFCPTGYSGYDDWMSYKSCHVDEDFFYGIHLVCAIVAVLGLLINFLVVAHLARRWHFASSTKFPSQAPPSFLEYSSRIHFLIFLLLTESHQNSADHPPIRVTRPSFGSGSVQEGEEKLSLFQAPEHAGSHLSQKRRNDLKRDWKRKRDTLLCLSLSFLFCLAISIYHITFLVVDLDERRDTPVHLTTTIARLAAWSFINIFFLSLTKLWYQILPNDQLMIAFLEYNWFFTKFPNGLVNVINVSIALSLFSSIILGVGMTIAKLEFDNESNLQLNIIYLYLSMFFYVELLVSVNLVFQAVARLQKEGIIMFTTASQQKMYNRQPSFKKRSTPPKLERSLSFGRQNSAEIVQLQEGKPKPVRTLLYSLHTVRILQAICTLICLFLIGIYSLLIINELEFEYLVFNASSFFAEVFCVMIPVVISRRTEGGLAAPKWIAARYN